MVQLSKFSFIRNSSVFIHATKFLGIFSTEQHRIQVDEQ